MKYLQGTFTLPAGPPKVTQEEWNRIFPPVEATCVHCELPIDLTPGEGGCTCLLDDDLYDPLTGVSDSTGNPY